MLIPFGTLVKKWGLKVRGVMHVGAHLCEEQDSYLAAGVKDTVWLEANPQLVLKQKSRGFDIHQILASDKDDSVVDFHVASNGQSSSMLELGVHKTYHPDVTYVASMPMKTKRIDTLAKEQKWNMRRFNFLNVDVQGADLLAIKGMDSLLKGFDAIYVEVNTDQVYIGCAQLPEMDTFLNSHGFTRKEISMTDNKWGDAFYLRETHISKRILLDVGAHKGLYSDVHMDHFDRLILVEASPKLADALKIKYRSNPKVVVVNKAVSDEKQVTMYLCNVDTISTASEKWVNESRFSGQGYEWTPCSLPVISMDTLIKVYGKPTKTKIDVEGYESHVIQSLNINIGPLSFEWAEEVREDAVKSIYHLLKLGYSKFYIQNQDKYDFQPTENQYTSIDTLIQNINLWNPKRRDAWGMIHCL